MIDLDKKIAQFDLSKSPKLLDLTKKAATAATKYGLDNKPARVALIIDKSGSMENPNRFYSTGQVQELTTRLAALGVLFDDDGQLDLFPFHTRSKFYKSVSPLQATTVIRDLQRDWEFGGTNYGNAIKAFHDYYWPTAGNRLEPFLDDKPPVYAIFVTDGATDEKRHALEMFKLLSFRPCFVQAIALGQDYDSNKAPAAPAKKSFWGLGGGSSEPELSEHLKFLAKLDDDVPGRYVDNVDFFGTKKPDSLPDEEFFDRMMGEFPQWLADPKVYGAMLGKANASVGWS